MKNLDIMKKRFGEKSLEDMAKTINNLEPVFEFFDTNKAICKISGKTYGSNPCDMCEFSRIHENEGNHSDVCDMLMEYIKDSSCAAKFSTSTCLNGIQTFLIQEYEGTTEKGEEFLDFFKHYDHIYYCEIIVLPDGTIKQASPSHQEALIKIMENKIGVSRNDVLNLFTKTHNVYDDFTQWLMDNTGCILVWYSQLLFPRIITKEQINTIGLLIKNQKIEPTEDLISEFLSGEEK